MRRASSRRVVAAAIPMALALAAAPLWAQQPTPGGAQSGTPSPASGLSASAPKADAARLRYTKADVQFMQHMIGHHAQALAMTSLVPTRTNLESMRLLAQRIEISQRDEIELMRHWLQARGQTAPDPNAPHEHHGAGGHDMLMPGMLTGEELARLAAASGPEFDGLFLQLMIRHHEGALAMVASLFATSGAGQETEAFRFASDVDADQRAEIARMRKMLEAMTEAHRP